MACALINYTETYLKSSPACSHPGVRKPRPPWLQRALQTLQVSAVVTAEYLKVVPQQRSGQRVRENVWLPQRSVSESGIGRRTCAVEHQHVTMVEVQEVNSGSQRQDTPSKSHHWSNVFSQPCQGCGLELRR